MAISIISKAFSLEALPSGWYSGDRSYGVFEMNSGSSLAENISMVAGLPAVKRHDDGSKVIIASRDASYNAR